MAMTATITASSGGTGVIALNPVAKSTTVQLTLTSCSSGAVQIEMSLDDPTIVSGPTTTWSLLSSGTAMLSSNIGGSNGGLIYTILSPVGQVRINSTQSATAATMTLKALQSVTA